MFARLTGRIDDIRDSHIIIDVGGVGYMVACSGRTRGELQVGAITRLVIETVVREDAINLYGFIDEQEQNWFNMLTSVQGVGPRVGMALLSALAPQELAKGIALGDTTILGRADGVGPKLAARLVTELKDKVPDQMLKTAAPRQVVRADIATEISGAGVDEQSVDHDAISALVNLGYGRTEAFAVVMRVREDGQEINVGNLISRALKELSRGAA